MGILELSPSGQFLEEEAATMIFFWLLFAGATAAFLSVRVGEEIESVSAVLVALCCLLLSLVWSPLSVKLLLAGALLISSRGEGLFGLAG